VLQDDLRRQWELPAHWSNVIIVFFSLMLIPMAEHWLSCWVGVSQTSLDWPVPAGWLITDG
jgi:hypothetical protein